MPDQPIADLATTLMNRELAKNPNQFKVARQVDRSEQGMSPHTLATLGGLADAASTYAFMKKGVAEEGNPLVRGIAGKSPELTGLTALGGLLATKGLTHLIGKKWPGAADAIAANLGAEQLGLGIHNLAKTYNMHHNLGNNDSMREYHNVLGRNIMSSANSTVK